MVSRPQGLVVAGGNRVPVVSLQWGQFSVTVFLGLNEIKFNIGLKYQTQRKKPKVGASVILAPIQLAPF